MRKSFAVGVVAFLFSFSCISADGAGDEFPWRCGAASVDITPRSPIWLAGYAARRHPSEGVLLPIHAKALALAWKDEKPVVVISSETCELPAALAEEVAVRLRKEFDLSRERVLICVTHTHSSPAIQSRLWKVTYPMDERNARRVSEYTRRLADEMFRAAEASLKDLRPARLSLGLGKAGFAWNRRRVNPDDPVDYDVPVLVAEYAPAPGREEKGALLFAYACHNTTLDIYEVSGDYAGFAQSFIEKKRPGWTAVFLSGCAGDINPHPRRKVELCKAHGKALAEAVEKVLEGKLKRVEGPVRVAFDRAVLPLKSVPARSELEKELSEENPYVRKRAEELLKDVEAGRGPLPAYPLPLQVWRLGGGEGGFSVPIVAFGGEAVVDYALRVKRELGRRDLFVVAYANDIPGYIPTERILKEGGYEGGGAQLYYCFHDPWAEGVERRVMEVVRRLLAQCVIPYGRVDRRPVR